MNLIFRLIYPGPNVITKISTAIFLIITLLLTQASSAFGQSLPSQAQFVFKLASPAVVMINVVTQDGARQGSAVAVKNSLNIESLKPDGTIFYTNWHVIQGAKSLSTTVRGIQYELKVTYADSQMDIASVKALGLLIEPVKISLTPPKIGDNVFAIGNPRGLEASISQGIVSGLRQNNETSFIQTTAPISPGSSGGGLFDNKGNLIGITTLRLGNPVEALNFAISAISFRQFNDAWNASESIARSLKYFFENADKDIAIVQSDGFVRWLYHPERQKVRLYFANDYLNEFLSKDLKELQKASKKLQETTDKVMEEYRNFQQALKSESSKPDQTEKIILLCQIVGSPSWTLKIDPVAKTINGNSARFTESSIEIGDEGGKFIINRYTSTITSINKYGSNTGSCQRATSRAF